MKINTPGLGFLLIVMLGCSGSHPGDAQSGLDSALSQKGNGNQQKTA